MGEVGGTGGRTHSPRARGEGALPEAGRPASGPEPANEPPPLGGRWTTLYAVVLGTLAVLIALFYAFTKAFE